MGRYRKTKQCPACGTGDLERFAHNSAKRDGLQTYCRECTKDLRSWSKGGREKTVRQKTNYDNQLIEGYIQHRLEQE